MVFEVKATHRVTSTGVVACEVHPDVVVDECGRVFVTAPAAVDDASIPAGLRRIRPEDENEVFVIDDDTIEFAVDWIDVLSGHSRAVQRIEQRSQRRWPPTSGGGPSVRVDIDRAALRGDKRTVTFEVRASHRNKSLRDLACEIYPDVFVGQSSRGAYSRYAGMAMQQPGDIVDALPDGAQEWFPVHGLECAVSWVSAVAGIRDRFWLEQHGGRIYPRTLVGPMGPSCPPRRLLTP